MGEKIMEKLSVIGIGKLGLCFSLVLEKSGFDVIGVDINQEYVDLINLKQLNTSEEYVEEYLKNSKNFKATTSLEEAVKHSNLLFVIVATPTLKEGGYSNVQIESVIQKLKNIGPSETEKHFIVCSTVMPGFCDSIKETMKSLNYTVSYNPEFIAQGTVISNQHKPDMVLIGQANEEIGNKIEKIYRKITTNNPYFAKMTPLSAEITKVGLNCFLATKIAYANMIGDISELSGGETEKILNAIGNDSRIGNKFLKYGFGYSGECIPRDGRALRKYSNSIGYEAKITLAADESNAQHLEFQFEQYKKKYSIKNEIVFEYVSFKPQSPILTESQSLKLAEKLSNYGYKVRIKERKEVIDQLKKLYKEGFFIYEQRD
jgi:nucleotide sugar dehydrogenase